MKIDTEKLALDAFYAMTAGIKTTELEREFFVRGFMLAIKWLSDNSDIEPSDLLSQSDRH